MSLREQMEAAKAAGKLTKCYEEDAAKASLIEFQPGPGQRYLLPVAQLSRAIWEDITPKAPAGYQGSPDRLRLAFATTDVVISGWRLGKLATLLHDHKLSLVRMVPGRADFPEHEPFIASITVTPLDEEPEPPEVEVDANNKPAIPLPEDRNQPSGGSSLRRHVRSI